MTTAIDISPEQLSIVQDILRKHLPKGTRTWAFGSRVAWTAKAFSDLDLAVEHAEPLSSNIILNLEEAFEESDLPWRVDVLDLKAVSSEFRAIVEAHRVPADWRSVALGDLCDKITDGAHQSPRSVISGMPMASVKDLTPFGVDVREARQISTEDFNALVRQGCKPEIGDILIAKDGNSALDTTCEVRATPNYVLLSSVAILRPNKSKLDSTYLRFALKNPDYIQYLKSNFISGAAIPRVVLKDFRRAELSLPDLETQRAIARVLSSLDDKIELNRRMNETLEGMAQAIFKDWFVDFGPVRRKLAGATDPVAIMGGLTPAPELAALFPDGFGDDGLPEGWTLGTVEDVIELAYGKSLPKTERSDGAFPVYGSGGANGTHNEALVKGPGIIVGRKGTVGSLYWEQGDFFAIDTVFYVKPRNGFSFEQVWFLLGSLGLEHMNTDAAVPGLNRNNVYRLEVAMAPVILQSEFYNIAAPLRAMTENNNTQNRILAETRDYLLPKLMSGQVRVRDAEKMVEDAV